MTTDQRIENLEKGLASARRFNRWLLAAVGLALGVWILAVTFGPTMAAAPAGGGVAKEVRANRFIVEDENSKVRASLDASMNAPGLTLFNENGKPSASLDGSKISRGLALLARDGSDIRPTTKTRRVTRPHWNTAGCCAVLRSVDYFMAGETVAL